MKKQLLILTNSLIIALMLSMTIGCNDDDEDGASTEAKLIGTWTTQSVSFDITINGEDIIPYLMEILGASEEQAQAFYDQAFAGIEDNYEGTVTINSDGTYESSSFGEENTSGTWALSSDGKKITLDAGTDDEVTADIIQLTDSTLRLAISETESSDLDLDGTADELSINVEMTLTK